MFALPSNLRIELETHLQTRQVPNTKRGAYLKWLRYFLDFCDKYHFPEEIQVVVVVHGPATTFVLSNTAFQESFKKENADRAIIRKWNDVGVEFYVCGQSLAEKGIDHKLVDYRITVAFSAMSTVTS